MKVTSFKNSRSYETSEGRMTPLLVKENLSVIHLDLPKGLQVQPHSHPHPGILFLITGSITMQGDEEITLHEGDIAEIPADYTVGLYANELSRAVLLSAPSRYRDMNELYDCFDKIFQ